MLQSEGIELVSETLFQVAKVGLATLKFMETGETLSKRTLQQFKSTLDACEYEVFHLGVGLKRKITLGFCKPDPLNRHNIAIQPAVRLLVQAIA